LIFVTVGTQLPFDRMVAAVNAWARDNPAISIFAQTGVSALTDLTVEHSDFVPPAEAKRLIVESELIVAHAGMGSILTALRHGKPILIMPRKAALGEHRNDHQMATAKWLESRSGIFVAWDEHELRRKLDERSGLISGEHIAEYASPELLARVRQFITD
jgi:UDP-N-acetylglucosamine transferase subunit ALG13